MKFLSYNIVLAFAIFGCSSLILGQEFCPPGNSCDNCGVDWRRPEFTEQDQNLGPDLCTVTLRWDWTFNASASDPNPRMTFVCSYADSSFCNVGEENVCATCEEITIYYVQPSKSPSIAFSDTCGNLEDFRIAENCSPIVTTTTTSATTTTTTTQPETTKTPVVTTEAAETTKVPVVTTEAAETTKVPVVTTVAAETTKVPVVTTEAAETTKVPIVTTEAAETTKVPVVTTAAAETTEVPVVTTVAAETTANAKTTVDSATTKGVTEQPASTINGQHTTNHDFTTFGAFTTDSSANYCPSPVVCKSCPSSWEVPDVYEIDVPLEEDLCDVQLFWDTNLVGEDGSPRISFTCIYGQTGEYCTPTADVLCASCGNVTLENLRPSLFPYVTYTDNCGLSHQFIVAANCWTPPETSTPEVVNATCPDALQCSGCPDPWTQPLIKVTGGPSDNGTCDLYISWDWTYGTEVSNPQFTFQCIYGSTGNYCEDQFEATCGSCKQVLFTDVNTNMDPYINFSDTCGDLYRLNIGNVCQ